MFPYAGTVRSILPQLLAVFAEREFHTLVDPFAGSGNLPYRLALSNRKEPFKLVLNDLNFYSEANLEAVFNGVHDLPDRSELLPYTELETIFSGKLYGSGFGYWNDEYRKEFDSYVHWANTSGPTVKLDILGLLGKVLMEATFRGQAWADVDAAGFNIPNDYTTERLRSQLERVHKWVKLRLNSKILPTKVLSTQVTGLDAVADPVDLKRGGEGVLLYIDCPWPWTTANTSAYEFYNDVNFALVGERSALSWDGEAEEYESSLIQSLILPHLRDGSTILMNKQSTTLPTIEGLENRFRAFGVEVMEVTKLPIRGRQGANLPDQYELLSELRAC